MCHNWFPKVPILAQNLTSGFQFAGFLSTFCGRSFNSGVGSGGERKGWGGGGGGGGGGGDIRGEVELTQVGNREEGQYNEGGSRIHLRGTIPRVAVRLLGFHKSFVVGGEYN